MTLRLSSTSDRCNLNGSRVCAYRKKEGTPESLFVLCVVHVQWTSV